MTSGRELGGYRLGRRIAVGGMAEIFEARRGSGPTVVVKLLLPQYAKDPNVVRMLEHEGHLMKQLEHPCLIRVLDVQAGGDEPFLVLEMVDGVAASELLEAMRRTGERPTPEMALALVLPLLDALEHVHGAKGDDGEPLGVVHRDVTPHNLLVGADGSVKLGDFGIARSSMRDGRTRTGIIKGKLGYLAPEQVTGSTIDARTDLYAVGVMLWELLAAEPYLEGESEMELLRKAEQPTYRKPSEVGGDARFDRFLRRALSRFAEERPRDAATFRERLMKAAGDLDPEVGRARWARCAETRLASEPTPRSELARSESSESDARRARVVAAWPFAIAAALAAAAVVIVLMDEPGEPQVPAPPSELTSMDVEPIERSAPAPAPEPPEPEAPTVEAPESPVVIEPPPRRPAAPRRVEPTPRAPPSDPPIDEQAHDRARTDLGLLRSSLRERGILESDLEVGHRASLRAIGAAIDDGDLAEARRQLASVSPALRAMQVDEPFVRAKLERVDARIRAARARGVDVTEIERLSALALQDLLARRPEATNRRLNQILTRLR